MDDIILNKNQYDMLYGESGRNGISILSRRWSKNQLPYEFDYESIASGSPEETMIKEVISRFNSEMDGCFSIVWVFLLFMDTIYLLNIQIHGFSKLTPLLINKTLLLHFVAFFHVASQE